MCLCKVVLGNIFNVSSEIAVTSAPVSSLKDVRFPSRQIPRNQPFVLVEPSTPRKADSSTLSKSTSDTDLTKPCEQICPRFQHL